MLNRLYIVFGLLAIAVLAAAFIVPRFVQWSDYRERMQALASEAIGADVRISGDIAFTLLPQPRLKFGVVTVGPPTAPVMTVNDVEAELSLIDFLRDRYTVTHLVLNQPTIDVAVDTEGNLDFPMPGAPGGPSSQLTLSNAVINDGQVRFTDRRSGNTIAIDALAGELRFVGDRQATFGGSGRLGQRGYAFRFSTQPAEGAVKVSAFARPSDETFSMAVEGAVSSSPRLRFEGTAALRVAPPALQAAGGVRGPMVFAGKVNATTELVTFTDYTLTPDENRASTRLTGAANLTLGAAPSFSAVISGGVFALAPRDATEDQAGLPIELVRMLDEVPAPLSTFGIPGRVGIDIAEFNLRVASLRNLRIDASTDGKAWQVGNFTAQLPGATMLSMTGALGADGRRAAFSGQVTLESQRLDVLAALWHPAAKPGALAGASATYRANVDLKGSTLTLSDGVLGLGGKTHTLSATLAGGANRRLAVVGAFDALTPLDSAQLEAMLPTAESGLAATFPEGEFDLTARAATLFGLAGEGLALRGDWGPDGVTFARVAADRLGEGHLLLAGSLSGTVQQPVVVATGRVSVAAADAPILGSVFKAIGVPTVLAENVRRSTPLELDVALGRPGADGAQALHAEGRAGAAALGLDVSLSQGLMAATRSPLHAMLSLVSADPQALTEQFALGPLALVADGTALRIAADLKGRPAAGLSGSVLITGGDTSLAFDGQLALDGERLTGKGSLNFSLDDLTPVAAWMGVERMQLPGVSGRADVAFGRDILITGIDAEAGGGQVSGELDIRTEGGGRLLSGVLDVGEVDVAGLVSGIAGPAALLQGKDQPWPDGPIDLGEAPPELSGRIEVNTQLVLAGDRELLSDASFTLGWSKGEVRVADVRGRVGGGTATGTLTICCSGPLPEKQASGRISLEGVDLAALLDGATATSLSGTLTMGVQFSTSGASIAEMAQALAGDGSYDIKSIELSDLNPAVFQRLAAVENLGKASAAQIGTLVGDGLLGGSYAAPQLSGGFALAGGVARSPNLLLDDATTRLSGGMAIDLGHRQMSGTFTLLPKANVDAVGLVSDQTAPIQIRLAGTLDAPERTLELQPLVDGITNKALEIELARLEQLQREEEARSRAAAEERARLMLWQKREQAVSTASATIADEVAASRTELLAAADEIAAQRVAALALAAEEARLAAERAAEDQEAPLVGPLDRPIDLGLPPLNRF